MLIKNINDIFEAQKQAIFNICKAFENLQKSLKLDVKYRRKTYKKARFKKMFKRMKEV
ncbi:MAG: hypothetical protein ACI4VF_05280 [Lachnospirales bacterium]